MIQTLFKEQRKRLVALTLMLGSFFLIDKGTVSPLTVESNQAQEQSEVSSFQMKQFGESTQGKPIVGYEIGKGEDVYFLFGSIHGNEMSSGDILDQLVKEVAVNPSIVSPNKKFVIIPITNPDGYYDRTDKLNANGVNLNLNFPTSKWQQYGPQGMFAGEEPFTEVESRIIRDVVESYKPRAMLSFHAKGLLVSPEYNDISAALGHWYADRTDYMYFDHEEWDFPGTATKWFAETTGKAAITIELPDYVKTDWKTNKKPLMELITSDTLSF